MPTQNYVFALFYLFAFGLCIDCGEERVTQPGENVTLECRCGKDLSDGWDIVWVKSCSSLVQPMVISIIRDIIKKVPRYHTTLNTKNKSYNLIIENITEADLGLYYCAEVESIKCDKADGKLTEKHVYHICNGSTKLIFEVPPPVSSLLAKECECSVCWLLLQTMSPVCALLSALLSSLCVFCCCRRTVLKEPENRRPSTIHHDDVEQFSLQAGIAEVTYASLNIPKNRIKQTKNNTSVNPNTSLYSEINKGHR